MSSGDNNNNNNNSGGDDNDNTNYPPKAPFNQYPFEKDPRWPKYLRSIEAPSELSEQEFMYRIKRKFYRQYIDTSESPSSSPATHTATSSGTAPNTIPQSNNYTYNGNSTQQTYRPSSTENTSNASATPNLLSSTLFDFSLGKIPEKIWLIASLSIMIHGALCLVPFIFSFETNLMLFHRFLFSAIISYSVSLLQTHGMPQFNVIYFQRFMLDNNAQFLLVCLMLLSNPPNPLFVFPVIVYSALHVSNYLLPILQQTSPSVAAQLTAFQQQHCNRALFACAYSEFFTILLLIIQVFSGGGIFIILFYFQFLTFRYLMNSYSRAAFSEIGEKTDQLFAMTPPLINGYYQTFREYLSQFVASRYGGTHPGQQQQ